MVNRLVVNRLVVNCLVVNRLVEHEQLLRLAGTDGFEPILVRMRDDGVRAGTFSFAPSENNLRWLHSASLIRTTLEIATMLFRRSTHTFRSRYVLTLLMLIAMSIMAVQSAHATLRACRADPIVWLSNGESVQMTTAIAADAADVRKITYTLHVPEGLEATKIVYTGGALTSKEEVVFVADMLPGQYSTDTVVTMRQKGVSVTATTGTSGIYRDEVTGLSNEHLIQNFTISE